MADPELIHVMDYILNRCDEKNIEAVVAAVVRRRRDLALFGGKNNLPDPQKWARDLSSQIGKEAGTEALTELIQDMAVRIIRQEAPELSDEQAAELTRAWVPGDKASRDAERDLPPDLLESMVDQFISYSTGRMSGGEDQRLRSEMGSWPDRYWKAFPQVVQLIIRDFLKGEIPPEKFRSEIGIALKLR
ncbi:MAG: hypothetical protein LBP42_01440 [Treponema sp.]|jgi:hypothetical protein|nr:hypothetical protein [Treponema sp.]